MLGVHGRGGRWRRFERRQRRDVRHVKVDQLEGVEGVVAGADHVSWFDVAVHGARGVQLCDARTDLGSSEPDQADGLGGEALVGDDLEQVAVGLLHHDNVWELSNQGRRYVVPYPAGIWVTDELHRTHMFRSVGVG